MSSKFTGTGVALVTPFKEDQSVDFAGLKNLLSHVISNGVNYLVVNGTTGESPTLTRPERDEVLEFVINENKGKLPIVFGIGGNNTSDIVEKIQKTNLKGVDGILSVSPYYNKPSQEGIYHHYKAIAEASPIPIILYNVPGRTGSNIAAKTTVRLSEIKNIVGIKEASTDLMQSLEILKNARKDFSLISGDDMLTVPLISMGGKGAISVIANGFPKKFSEMVNYALGNNFREATEILKSFLEINSLLYEEGNPVGIKQVLANFAVCKNNARLPLSPASADLQSKIKKAMASINKEG